MPSSRRLRRDAARSPLPESLFCYTFGNTFAESAPLARLSYQSPIGCRFTTRVRLRIDQASLRAQPPSAC